MLAEKKHLTANGMLPEEAWPTQVTKHDSEEVKLHFEKGELTGVNDKTFDSSFRSNSIFAKHCRTLWHWQRYSCGDTIIGIKGRVGFEAAAPMVILKAHHALEKHVLTKWQLSWKDNLLTSMATGCMKDRYLIL